MTRWVDVARVVPDGAKEGVRRRISRGEAEHSCPADSKHAGELTDGSGQVGDVLENTQTHERVKLAVREGEVEERAFMEVCRNVEVEKHLPHSLGFAVEIDAGETTRRLDAAGIRYNLSQTGRRALFCRDTDDNALEFIEQI